jgi:hypothetical protein
MKQRLLWDDIHLATQEIPHFWRIRMFIDMVKRDCDIYLKSGNHQFLPFPLQFIICLSFHHLTLFSLATDNTIE